MKNSRYKKENIIIFLALIGISLFLVGYDNGFYTMSLKDAQTSAQQYADENKLVLGEMIGVEGMFIFTAMDQVNPERSIALLYRKSKYTNSFRESGVKRLKYYSNNKFTLNLDIQNTNYFIEYEGFNLLRVEGQENESEGMDPNLLPFLGYLIIAGFIYKKLTKQNQVT